jgi:hypothetical protein
MVLGYLPQSVQLSNSSSDISYKVSLVEIQVSSVNITSVSLPLGLNFDKVPCNSSSSSDEFCGVLVDLKKVRIQKYANQLPSNHSLHNISMECEAGEPLNESFVCPAGDIVTLSCDGRAGVTSITCPLRSEEVVCKSIGRDQSTCRLISSDDQWIRCLCTLLPPSSGRRLSQSLVTSGDDDTTQETNDEGVSINFVAAGESVWTEFVSTWKGAGSLNARSFSDSLQVLFTVAALVISGLLFIFVSVQLDRSDAIKRKAEVALRGSQVSVQEKRSKSRLSFVKKVPKQNSRLVGSPEQQSLESSLPSVLLSIPVWRKFSNEIQMHHRWVGVFCHYSPTYSRPVRVLSLLVNIVTMLFLEAVTFDLADPDDGSCERMNTEPDCLSEQSSLANENKCYWDLSTSSCHFRPIDNDFIRVMIVALFAALISTPFALVFQSLIMFVLAGEIIDKSASNSTNQIEMGRSKSSISPSVSRTKSSLMHQDSFRLLITEITKYRSKLNEEKREEFDLIWGLDFATLESSHLLTVLKKNVSNIFLSLLTFEFDDIPQEVRIMKELDVVAKTSSRELEFFENPWVDEVEKRKRLIFLFVKDLLDGINGSILDVKDRLDNSKKLKVTYQLKVLTSLFLFGMSFGMLFYIYLFAMRQTATRQNAWFNSFITWLMFEICLVSSMMVLTQHVLIPSTSSQM